MNVIDVGTSSPYPVIVGKGLIEETGDYIRHYFPHAETAAVITDDTVDGLYGEKTTESITAAGLRAVKYVLPHGEASKTIETYAGILQFLAEEHITRTDMIVALGGGVVGDLAGFAAATFLRGIDFLQIPTTLLAQVDSSVGGKTAVDLPAGKNLAGAFYQPRLVLCDLDTLDTLPAETFTDGCAEVIKYGILWDEDLFEHLYARGQDFDREYTVSRCIEMKRDVVVEDEFDRGQRRLLNLGHTLAHAAEQLSDYRLTHGRAVAAGMAVMAGAAAFDKSCSEETKTRIVEILTRFGLPTDFECALASCEARPDAGSAGEDTPAAFSPEAMYEVMLSDKKRKGSKISIVIPRAIGECEIRKMSLEEMKDFVMKAL